MNLLDLLLFGLMGLGVWRGLQTGATVQIAGIAGWILAFWAAARWSGPVGDVAVASLDLSLRTAPVVGALVVFTLVAGGVWAVAHAMRKTLEALKLGPLDRVAGAGVGGVRAAFGASVVLAALSFAPFGEPLLLSDETCEASVFCAPVRGVAPAAWDAWTDARDARDGITDG